MKKIFQFLFVLFVVVASFFLVITVSAQDYDCTGTPNTNGFSLNCVLKQFTPTPQPTKTPVPTATATATALPPTPPITNQVVFNVPIFFEAEGNPIYDAANWSIIWFGEVSNTKAWADIRFVGTPDNLKLRAQIFERFPVDGAKLNFVINGKNVDLVYRAGGEQVVGLWTVAGRCIEECRGWSGDASIPWSYFGGKPVNGDTWEVSASYLGQNFNGILRWGLPNYNGVIPPAPLIQNVNVTEDATLGGTSDCGYLDWPNHFETWGWRNYETYIGFHSRYEEFSNVQNQWDVADWPCYSKYIMRVPIPENLQNFSGAFLNIYRFGHPGYNPGDTGTSIFQAYEVNDAWEENTVAWNTIQLGENVSHGPVTECTDTECGSWFRLDISELVRRAIARGEKTVDAVFYSANGNYHSGKYFYTSEGAAKPFVQFVSGGIPETPTPVIPTPTPVVVPTLTPTTPPTATPVVVPTATPTQIVGQGKTYYMTPTDSFEVKLSALQPGDTLILRDGVYKQVLMPMNNGVAGKPITVKAENDGKAIIDGEFVRKVVETGHTRPGRGNFYVFEGIVGKNSIEDVWFIRSDNVQLKRVSGYNASNDKNSSVFTIWSNNALIEDCIAAGTGRKMILLYQANNTTVRRCFTQWAGWSGRDFCGVTWPNAETVQVYNGSNNIFENILATGPSPVWLLAIQANDDAAIANNNKVLGSIASGAGLNIDGTEYNYGPRPLPSACGNNYRDFSWNDQRAGMMLWGQGTMKNNVFRDVLVANNAGLGFSFDRPYSAGVASGNVVERMTAYNNAEFAPYGDGNLQVKLNGIVPVDSKIEGSGYNGAGARLTNRYVNGILTNEALLPFPMQSRGLAELNVDISGLWRGFLR
mgnify:CR=1 FL=1